MKILYYSSPSFADCDFPLVKTLMEQGHDVTYLIDLSPSSCKRTLFNIEKCLPVNDIIQATAYKELLVYKNYLNLDKVYIINKGSLGRRQYLKSLSLTLKVARFINKGKFDVIHTDILFVSFQPLLFLLCKPWIITKHDPFPHSEEVSRITNFYRQLSFKLCHHFVLLNSQQRDKFCKTFKIPKSNVLINRLGIYDNIQVFAQESWQKRKKNILFFGRITPYKGLEYLFEAMVEIHKQIPQATLTVAGGGNYYFDISKYRDLPYIEIINRYVSLDELAKLLYESTIVVCPYKEATQSGVIMTAYSMCKPVVVTNVGGLAEMVDDGKSGIVISPCDIMALQQSLVNLLRDKNVLDKMSDYIKNNYFYGEKSWSHIASTYTNYYRKVIEENIIK